MKKFLEVLIDDAGEMHFNSECEFVKNTPLSDRYSVTEKLDEAAIRALVRQFWEKQDPEVAFAIRVLSMAEIVSTPNPYERAEEFWYSMMHDYIPSQEKFAEKLKVPFGFDPKSVVRPIVFFNPEFFGPNQLHS